MWMTHSVSARAWTDYEKMISHDRYLGHLVELLVSQHALGRPDVSTRGMPVSMPTRRRSFWYPSLMIHRSPPPDFVSRFSAAACFIEHAGRLLLLYGKEPARAWGLPAGRMKDSESPIATAIRELSEETGYVARIEEMSDLGVTFVCGSQVDYTFYLYRMVLDYPITVRLDEREHSDYRWVTPSEALSLPFIEHLDGYLHLHYADELHSDGT